MLVDDSLITYLEDLSCLALSADERVQLSADLEKILHYMDKLNEVDTVGITERSHPFDNVNAFRSDEAAEPFDRELILKNAPCRNDETFVAPDTA